MFSLLFFAIFGADEFLLVCILRKQNKEKPISTIWDVINHRSLNLKDHTYLTKTAVCSGDKNSGAACPPSGRLQ